MRSLNDFTNSTLTVTKNHKYATLRLRTTVVMGPETTLINKELRVAGIRNVFRGSGGSTVFPRIVLHGCFQTHLSPHGDFDELVLVFAWACFVTFIFATPPCTYFVESGPCWRGKMFASRVRVNSDQHRRDWGRLFGRPFTESRAHRSPWRKRSVVWLADRCAEPFGSLIFIICRRIVVIYACSQYKFWNLYLFQLCSMFLQ